MPELIKLRPGELPGREALHRAVEAARRGEVVAFPTDTVYGLGTSATSRAGVERICRIKGRPADKPLPLLAASAKDLRRICCRRRPRRSPGRRPRAVGRHGRSVRNWP